LSSSRRVEGSDQARITDDLNQQMASMKAQILSRSRLEVIINKFNLYAQDRAKHPMDDLVEKLKASIDVELIQPITGSANHEPPGFNISVTLAIRLWRSTFARNHIDLHGAKREHSHRKLNRNTDFLTQQ